MLAELRRYTLGDLSAVAIQPARQPLTTQQINEIADGMAGGLDGFMKGWGWRQFARAIEAAHGITKEGGAS